MKKILIVDDDADMREVMSTILADKYELAEANSKSEGLNKLKEIKPDLIVLDVMMEDLSSGFEMAREVKLNDKLKGIKDINGYKCG